MTITLFSTKAFKTSDLFGDKRPTNNSDAIRALNNYYLESLLAKKISSLDKELVHDVAIESLLNLFQKKFDASFGSEVISKIKTILPDDSIERESIIMQIINSSNIRAKDGLNTSAVIDTLVSNFDVLSILIEDKDNNKQSLIKDYFLEAPQEQLQRIISSENDIRQVYYVESAPEIYGVECLDTPDSSNKWIECLLNCVLYLASNDTDTIDVQLVLHDKDIPDYAEKDVYVLNDEELDNIAPNWKSIEVNKKRIANLNIAFFHHTSNTFARIVVNPYDQDKRENIHETVRNYINDYFTTMRKVVDADNELYL